MLYITEMNTHKFVIILVTSNTTLYINYVFTCTYSKIGCRNKRSLFFKYTISVSTTCCFW